MAFEKSNNVRILQSTKKSQVSPMLAAALGFFAGLAVISMGAYVFFLGGNHKMSHPEAIQTVEYPNQKTALSPAAQKHTDITSAYNTVIDEEPLEKRHLAQEDDKQVYESDLVNAFRHPNEIKPAAENTQNPLAVLQPKILAENFKIPVHKPVPQKAAAAKVKTEPAQILTKAPLLPAVKKSTVVPEEEAESPPGSLNIAVTKSLNPAPVVKPAAES
ncbi:hypothetical protein [Acinetobacter tianfuensis]|uniref:Uncharacterized protein n=1 Tax=Acinetobacter tianfuensis TaxID=2419603 RepID=A0A3A8E629_9GAMM|nr:hypothetical protein [Acinetobacter tianfuensis]RKG29629.1 hypothetical protein D7V32_14140 [Acinetobacter tianfuensis]